MNESLIEKLGDTLIDRQAYEQNHSSGIQLDTTQGCHYYKCDAMDESDTGYPSVTTILKSISYNEYIVKWANSLGFRHIKYADELDRTARIGVALHAAAQEYVDPGVGKVYHLDDPLIDYYVRKRMRSLRDRLELERPWSTYFTETTFIDKANGFGGTIDWFCKFHGKPTVADFKSASGLREKFLYQLGAYMALLSANGIKSEQAMVVLPKEENCTLYLFSKEDMDKAVTAFFHAKEFAEEHNMITTLIEDKNHLLQASS